MLKWMKNVIKEMNNMSKRTNVMATWKEFNPLAGKSIKDDFQTKPSPNNEAILNYLDNGEIILTSPSKAIDIISGDIIAQTTSILTDGEYSWSNSLKNYVQKYNLKIPKGFEKRIINITKTRFE